MRTLRPGLLQISCLLGMTACLSAVPPESEPSFRIATRNDGDKVEMATIGGKAVLTIESRRGIGQARMERISARWPTAITIRLFLRGLESFTVANGTTTLSISVASHGDHVRTLRLIENGQEGPALGKESPGWTTVGAFDKEGAKIPGLPGVGGYFELVLPPALTKDNPAGFELTWIDFYRG